MPSENRYLGLGDRVFLKRLEFPAVYDAATDEVYEVDPAGFEELSRCDGTLAVGDSLFPHEFLDFCMDEGVLVARSEAVERPVSVGVNETPSLRYLMLEVTDRCNLTCAHCYLGDTEGLDMSAELAAEVARQFDDMGGLRLVLTGGEPLLHPEFARLNELAGRRACRTILVTNGTLLDEDTARALSFDEVQVSLDGIEPGHELIRGRGSFAAALRGVRAVRAAGRDLSIATMVHAGNLEELGRLEQVVRDLGAVSWTLDVPCEAGRMAGAGHELAPPLDRAAVELERAYGSEQHEPSGEYACGAHLGFVRAGGELVKCGFYPEWSGGRVADGLREAWRRLPRMALSELDCDCEYIQECGGGCRYRAETAGARTGPDPLKCAQFGIWV